MVRVLLKPKHLGLYRDIGILLVKHRRSAAGLATDTEGADRDSEAARRDAESLADELERMGPTFVKLGQLLSTRSDLLPPVYLDALARLQDRVAPFGFEEVEAIVTAELGVRLSKAFARFESTPLASASLGQVHRAELRDGRPVVVKVQRPNIRTQIVDDMDAIESIAEFADAHTETGRRLGFVDMVAEFRRSLMAELDYRQEAANLVTLGQNLERHPNIVVPQPVPDYTTRVVLTMDYIRGRSVGALGPLAMMELDGPALARELFSAYLDQILVDGFFHADPHPGNVLVTDDGKLGLLDLGMVARVAPEIQDSLIKLLLAVSQGEGRNAADIAIRLGHKLDDYDGDAFRREAAALVVRTENSKMGELQAGALIGELTRVSGECGLRLPAELTMLGKAMLNLDEVTRTLDPAFDPDAAIERDASELMRRKLVQSASPGNMIAAAIEAKQFAEHFPDRLNRLMDTLAEGEMRLKVEGIDEENLMRGVQKLANRVTAGMVIASLVIGAALIMRIPTSAQLFGYPAIAIVLFLVAAASAAWLLVSIQFRDLPQRGRRR
ncbi:MAG TPA: AarF/UbiB family protein [Acidimicrobiia bacterium]|jgi:predicted unusual protein kinase regulating ubiquinone biosynthesis (AarF/ABC1/UbiB family)|nr:AarF/UbiB family protein [Acidimicrobiia bacterium]